MFVTYRETIRWAIDQVTSDGGEWRESPELY